MNQNDGRNKRGTKDAQWRDWNEPPDAPNCVTIFGAGIAGLTAAHELVERGFQVQVWEPAGDERRPERGCDVGGLARTQWVAADWPLERNAAELPGPLSQKGKADVPFEDRGTRPITHLPLVIYVQWTVRHFVIWAPERWAGPEALPPRELVMTAIRLLEQSGSLDRTTDVRIELRMYGATALPRKERTYRILAYLEASFTNGERAQFKDLSVEWLDGENHLMGWFRWREKRFRFELVDPIYAYTYNLTIEFFDKNGEPTAPRLEARGRWAAKPAVFALERTTEFINALFSQLPDNAIVYVEVASREMRLLSDTELETRAESLASLFFRVSKASFDGAITLKLPGDAATLYLERTGNQYQPLPRGIELIVVALDEFPYPTAETPSDLEVSISFRPRERWIPGEHGYRFFPSFYHHLFDTMKRTPLLEARAKPPFTQAQERSAGMKQVQEHELLPTNRTCFDNIYPTSSHVLALANGQRPSQLSRHAIRSLEELRQYISVFFGRRDAAGFGLDPRDVARISVKILQFATACDERRAEYEAKSWAEFLDAPDLSANAQRLIERWPRALVAMSAKEADARTHWVPLIHLLLDQVREDGYRDGTLRGPTSEAWLEPWREYLEGQGVEFIRGQLVDFKVVEDPARRTLRVWPVVDCYDDRYLPEQRPAPLRPGYFIIAVSTPEAIRLADKYASVLEEGEKNYGPQPNAACRVDTDLQRARRMGDFDPPAQGREPSPVDDEAFRRPVPTNLAFRHFVGVQFYFAEDVFWIDGHVYYPNSPWSLTSISQVRFWQAKVDWQYGYRGVLSVIIGEWNRPDEDPKEPRTAWDVMTKFGAGELARRTWEQIKVAIAGTQQKRSPGVGRFARRTPTADLPDPILWHVDSSFLRFGPRRDGQPNARAVPYVPLFISPPGRFEFRPGSVDPDRGYTVENGFVLAGHHMQTFTRLPSMEAANESARHAVNAILRHRKTYSTTNAQYHGSLCDVWSPEDREIDDLQFFRDLDEKLWKKDRPHVLEVLEADRLAKNVLRGGIRDPLDPIRWLERTSRMYRRPPFDRKDDDQ